MTGGLRVLILLISLVLVAGCGSPTRKASSAEDFDSFLTRFLTDKEFRRDRVPVPLTAVLAVCGPETPKVEHWSREEIDRQGFYPLDRAGLDAEGLTQRVERISEGETELTQYQEESDSYVAVFRFSLRGGQWFLVKVEDRSC